MKEEKIFYFEKPGQDNTGEVFRIVKNRAAELGIKNILIASTRGEAAVKAVEFFEGFRVIAVSHATGLREPNVQQFSEECRRQVESKGGTVLTMTHAFTGIGGAMRKRFNMYLLGDIIASTLRIFGQGMKVVCEMTLMATDAGLIRAGEDVIAVAGTGRGSDTAVVIRAVNTNDFFDMKVKEIICKPNFEAVPVPATPQAAAEAHHHHH